MHAGERPVCVCVCGGGGGGGRGGGGVALRWYMWGLAVPLGIPLIVTPRAHARARGYVIRRGVHILFISLDFFWNQSFISQNTHFQRSILTQIGFSSNLMASGIA